MTIACGIRAALLAAAVLAAAPTPGAAQQPVDSARIKMLRTLERLGRLPGSDTAASPEDTLEVTPLQVVSRPTAAPATSTDSVINAILALPGYQPTQYRGTAADFDAQSRVLVLRGDSTNRASVVRQGTELSADSLIRYDEVQGLIRAEGAPVFKAPEGDPVESQRVVYDVAANRGSAFGARTKYSEGATWFVTGDLPSVTPGVVYGAHTDFTSCELEEPHYHFTADNVKILAGRILVARPVTLYFADVPVAWLPFFAQGLGTGRASGLLMPRFSINDIVRRGGYRRRVSNIGFYWAMSEYSDATVAFDWFSGSFTSVTGSVRYAWNRQFLNGSLNFRQYWRDEGGTEIAFDTNHDWKMDERTSFRVSARYAETSDFVRRYSFDPVEVTQSINSTGGLDRRFDWGNISISGNRDQYLNDDRVLMTLPQAQINLSQITLFRAPALRARWYNNLVWSGNANGVRRTTSYADSVTPTNANRDTESLDGGASSRFSLGNLSWSQGANLRRGSTFGALVDSALAARSSILGVTPSGRALVASAQAASALAALDVTQTNLDWNTTLAYQQTLIGSTSITPSLSLAGNARRSDTIDVARDRFVSAPSRLSFGVGLKSDLFGFFPGVGPFEAIRHKLSPTIDFSYAPEVRSTDLQRRVFGPQAIQPRKEIMFGLNNTFEAKRKPRTDSAAVTGPATAAAAPAPSAAPLFPGALPGADTAITGGGLTAGPATGGFGNNNMRRAPRAEIVNLLSLRTNVVQYDFVEADSLGDFLFGFRTTQLSSQISSDFLQGLSISMAHDLFADTTIDLGGGEKSRERRFDMHLSNLNLGFSLNNRSAIVRGFGLFGGDEPDTAVAQVQQATPENPFLQTTAATDESSVIPRADRRAGDLQTGYGAQRSSEVGSWNANFSYSLVRQRTALATPSQAVQVSFTVKPTPNWDLSWRTSYDLERKAFNDHSLTLTRDIHDWDAHFDFARTATGNWFFRFDVALKANRDFKFDYKQQNTDATRTDGTRR
jgi:lipopolysaccharide assembly outer membrane protein LptD (OstA)